MIGKQEENILNTEENVRKIDEDNGCIIMENKTSIEISKIVDISINEKIVTFD